MILGILGTGMIVKDLMKTFDKLNIEKTYILARPNNQDVTTLKDTYHLDRIYYDYDELLESDVDTIYVALPNFLHYSFSKKALEAGKHVICEKPFTSNIKELEELIQIAKSKNRILLEAMTVSYMPAFQSVQKEIKNLGDIKIVSLNYSQYSSRYDAFKSGVILPAFDVHKSGGALYDINVYNVHFLVNLFGAPKDIQYLPNIEKGIDTSGILTLDYGTFKAVAIGAKDCGAPVMNVIQGDKGSIVVNEPVNRMKHYTYQNQEVVSTSEEHAMYYEFKTFIEIIHQEDFKKAQEKLEISRTVMEILTSARKKGGIYFDADR